MIFSEIDKIKVLYLGYRIFLKQKVSGHEQGIICATFLLFPLIPLLSLQILKQSRWKKLYYMMCNSVFSPGSLSLLLVIL